MMNYEGDGILAGIRRFYHLNKIRATKFLITGGGGFAVSEIVIFTGTIFARGYLDITLVLILANVISVTFGFFLNDMWSTRNQGVHNPGYLSLLSRLIRFQAVYVLGDLTSIAVQLSLLKFYGIIPDYGNIAGSIVAIIPNYIVSMKLVWGITVTRE
ncbi:MAG: GtrA family protein [Thermoplasmataceae archaeon]|jgi:putative flippase GtrA